MSFRKFRLAIAAVVLSTLSLAGTSKADFITQTFVHASAAVPYTYNFSANQFDPAQGTLNNVVISVTSNITGEVDIVNITAAPIAYTDATASVPVSLTGPAGLGLNVTATTPGQSGSANPGTTSIPGLSVTAMVATTLSTPGALAPYIGTGTNNLSFSFAAGKGTYSGSSTPGLFFGGSASADASITITYNFTPVPEPASLALLGLGGVAGLLGRKSLRRKAMLS